MNFFQSEHEFYQMNNPCRGVALVINNIAFSNKKHKRRKGAEVDSANLQRVLSKLQF